MGRWTNWKPGDPPPPPVQYPLSSPDALGQGIDNKDRLFLDNFGQRGCPNPPATEKGENLGIPPFPPDAVGRPTVFGHFGHFGQRFRHPDICPNGQFYAETLFSQGLDKKIDSGGSLGEAPACPKCPIVQKPPPAECEPPAAKVLQPDRECSERPAGPGPCVTAG